MRAVCSVAVAKPAAMAAKPSAMAKPNGAPARHECDDDAGERQRRGRPASRFPVGGEIAHDAEAESDRQPGHQPARRDFGKRPLRQQAAEPGGALGEPVRQHEPGAPARGVDLGRPGFGARSGFLVAPPWRPQAQKR